MLRKLTPETMEEFAHSNNIKVVKFSATWCGPCGQMNPIFEKVAESGKFGDGVEFYDVDVDEMSKFTNEYRVMSVPTILFFKGGNLLTDVAPIVGIHQNLGHMLEDILADIESKEK